MAKPRDSPLGQVGSDALYKAYDQLEFQPVSAGSGASEPVALSLADVLADRADVTPSPLPQLSSWKARIEARWHKLDLAHDLAEDIGSGRWCRGLGFMVALGLAAVSFWPDFTVVEAATGTAIDKGSRDEFRSQMIMPLALGGDSGRRMGATGAVVPLASVPERPMVRFTATLGQGDSFAGMLQRAGVGGGDAAQVAALVSAVVPLGQIGPGTRFDLTLGRRIATAAARPLDDLEFRARFDLDLAIERRGGALVLSQRPIAVDATPLRIRGAVGSSLYRSARAGGVPAGAIQQYLQALDQHLSLDGDIAASDEFDVIVAYKRSARGENQAGQVLYAGLERGGKPRMQLMRWGNDGQFFEASGIGTTQAASQFAPVAGRITSSFGPRRHPILGFRRMHAGIDFGARWGAPIYAVSNGTVSYAGRHGGHGNYVRLQHSGGLGTGYAHMSRIAVAPGSQVRAGQVIGYVGSTGLSTGPHLHFEVYRGGQVINPLAVRFTGQATVDKQERDAFKARLAQLQAVVPGAALASLAPRQAEVRAIDREIQRLGE